MVVVAQSLDLLVHPFYQLSTLAAGFQIDEDVERNILSLRDAWLESIRAVASSTARYMLIVNSVQLDPSRLVQDFSKVFGRYIHNPYRGLYQQITFEAEHKVGDRLFLCSPIIRPEEFFVAKADSGLFLAQKGTTGMVYTPQDLKVVAYGEHLGVCVDAEILRLEDLLGVPPENIEIAFNKSLPATIQSERDGFVQQKLYTVAAMK